MLQWYKDAALTLPINAITPKWVSFPTKGQTKQFSLWLGDAYTSIVSQLVGPTDTTINLTQTDEFPTTGTVTIDTEQITYTGVTSTPATLTGCTRGANGTTAATHAIGTSVFPHTTYSSSGNITALVAGMTLGPNLMSLARPGNSFGPPGAPLLLPISSIVAGAAGAVQVNCQITAPAGPELQYTNLFVTITPVTRPGDAANGFVTITLQPPGNTYVQQRDQGLGQRLRLLPITRKVNANLPGFTWGQYRWRDNTTENAVAIVPTRWDIDTSAIQQDFIGGVGSIGETNDLEPIDLEEQQSSIFLRALRGQYFTGVKRYYFPSGNFNLEFLACYPGQPNTFQLLKPPREQTPVFVGRWRLDGQGFYEYDSNLNGRYRYPGTFDPSSPTPEFMVDRKTGLLTVNNAMQLPQETILLGVLSGGQVEEFDIPFYPVDKIVNMYVNDPTINIPGYTFDRENGFVSFPKVPGTAAGQPLFAVCDAAIAVLYEYDVPDTTQIQNTNIPDESDLTKNTRLLTPDLNPAFSGLSQGVVYLQHRVLRPVAVTLSADKPQIAIPPTLTSIIGLIAYGPVFYNGDHALLTATAIGSLPNEVVPGAQLQVVPGGFNPTTGQPLQSTPFRGLINGLDPNTNTIIVVTGGDGIANLVYQPEPNFGFYIPTTPPWVTSSTSFTPSAASWTSGKATLTFSTPISHEFVHGTTIRLAGFTPTDWNADWAIDGVDKVAGTVTFDFPNDLGAVSVIGTVSPTDTLLLPTPIPVSQIWDGPPTNEGWLEFVYSVLSNDPLFGLTTYPMAGFTDNISGGVATVQINQIPGLTLVAGQSITISNATSPQLDGTYVLLTAVLSTGVWTLTFNNGNGPLSPTLQTAGSLIATGSLPFTTNGTVNGAVTISVASWTGGIATFKLASQPTNLEIGQNVDIQGCTTSTLNGIQNVLTITFTGGFWFITTPTNAPGSNVGETESGATITYSNFRSNGVLAVWNKTLGIWQAATQYQVGDQVLDSNGDIEQVTAISGTGTSGSTAPTWSTLFGGTVIDNPGGNQITWENVGEQGPSTSVPIHVYDKNGNDYNDSIFSLTGNAQIVTGTPNVATVQANATPGGVSITSGDTITINNATNPGLDGTWVVATASLSFGVWTITFNTLSSVFPSTPQTSGTLIDQSRGFNGEVVKLVFNSGLPNPSQGFVQAYLFQFLEREIIQLQVVGTNIYSNSIMLQMETPSQLVNNPYIVLSTNQYPSWAASTQFKPGNAIVDSNGNIEVVQSISGSGTTQSPTHPVWATLEGSTTIDNPGSNQIVWLNTGIAPPFYANASANSRFNINRLGITPTVSGTP